MEKIVPFFEKQVIGGKKKLTVVFWGTPDEEPLFHLVFLLCFTLICLSAFSGGLVPRNNVKADII